MADIKQVLQLMANQPENAVCINCMALSSEISAARQPFVFPLAFASSIASALDAFTAVFASI